MVQKRLERFKNLKFSNDMVWGGVLAAGKKMKTELVRKKKERKKSLKSGLKTGLERFKNQKFSYLRKK